MSLAIILCAQLLNLYTNYICNVCTYIYGQLLNIVSLCGTLCLWNAIQNIYPSTLFLCIFQKLNYRHSRSLSLISSVWSKMWKETFFLKLSVPIFNKNFISEDEFFVDSIIVVKIRDFSIFSVKEFFINSLIFGQSTFFCNSLYFTWMHLWVNLACNSSVALITFAKIRWIQWYRKCDLR